MMNDIDIFICTISCNWSCCWCVRAGSIHHPVSETDTPNCHIHDKWLLLQACFCYTNTEVTAIVLSATTSH